jgi:hypothetical protein
MSDINGDRLFLNLKSLLISPRSAVPTLPPQQLDTSAEVSDVIARMPWWATRGLLYIIVAFFSSRLYWAAFSR